MNSKHTAVLFSLLILSSFAFADGGIIPFYPVYVDESSQTAIVAWNGEEELMILTISVTAQENIKALDVIPLPSNPTKVEAVDMEVFEKTVELFGAGMGYEMKSPGAFDIMGRMEGAPPLEITYLDVIEEHTINVVKVNDVNYFLEWIEHFADNMQLAEDAKIPESFKKTVRDYISRGINYFVFDFIEIDDETKSIKPLLFRFPSDSLFYPMEITANSAITDEYGEINLFLFSNGIISDDPLVLAGFFGTRGSYTPEYSAPLADAVEVSNAELAEINSHLSELFPEKAYAAHASYYGYLTDLTSDLRIETEDIYMPTPQDEFNQLLANVFSTSVMAALVLPPLSVALSFGTPSMLFDGYALIILLLLILSILPLIGFFTVIYFAGKELPKRYPKKLTKKKSYILAFAVLFILSIIPTNIFYLWIQIILLMVFTVAGIAGFFLVVKYIYKRITAKK